MSLNSPGNVPLTAGSKENIQHIGRSATSYKHFNCLWRRNQSSISSHCRCSGNLLHLLFVFVLIYLRLLFLFPSGYFAHFWSCRKCWMTMKLSFSSWTEQEG